MLYGPKNLVLSFSGKTLTHYGGVYLLYLFFKQIQLRSLLYHNLRFSKRNNRYSVAEEMLALIYPISLGLGRIETIHTLKVQWGLPISHRVTYLSQPNHSKTLPPSDGPNRSAQTQETPLIFRLTDLFNSFRYVYQ